jgi:flagellar biosynthesis protein FliP
MIQVLDVKLFDPLVVVSFGVFARHLASLSILRIGLGLSGMSFGIITLGLALFLTLSVVEPFLSNQKSSAQLQSFAAKYTDAGVVTSFQKLQSQTGGREADQKKVETVETSQQLPDRLGMLAFIVSQLSDAFRVGIYFLLPFFIIDLLALSILGLLGVEGFRHEVLTIPLKLLVFFAVDGWALVVEKLLHGFMV